MKKLVLVAVVLLAINRVNAQNFEIAVYTEPQLSWISSDESSVTYNGTVLQLNTGIELDMFFTKNYAFTVGVNMNNSGGKLLYSVPSSFVQVGDTLDVPAGSSIKLNIRYFGLPLGLKLKSEELGYTTFYFHGGLIPMIRSDAYASNEFLAYNKENIKTDVNVFNLNYFAEIGIEYRLGGNTALVAGLKWSSGLTDVTGNDLATNDISSVGLHLGILF